MGLMPVELQETDRFFVFCAPLTSSKVKWLTAATACTTNNSTTHPSAVAKQQSRSRSQMASEGSAAAVAVGARKVLPEDVLLVAVHGARVDLHAASLDKACSVPCNAAADTSFEIRSAKLHAFGDLRRLGLL